MNKHVLYTVEDFAHLTYEEVENNTIYELVVDGGLSICKLCGEYEAGLDNTCKPRKEIIKNWRNRNESLGTVGRDKKRT